MYRGTTPTNTFRATVDLSEAEVVYITYGQRGNPVIEKTKADITFEPPQDEQGTRSEPANAELTVYTFTVQLTQEETLRFVDSDVYIQIRARFPGETAIASKIIKTSVEMILKDGVI